MTTAPQATIKQSAPSGGHSMKTSNAFIARQCDQVGELVELHECIASGQVSAAQIEAHYAGGEIQRLRSAHAPERHFGNIGRPAPLMPEDYSAIRSQLCESHPGDWLHHYGPAVEAEVLKRQAPGYVVPE